jgi:hypothetical protein
MAQRKMVWVELTPGTYVWRPKRSFWQKLQIAVETKRWMVGLHLAVVKPRRISQKYYSHSENSRN